MNADLEGLPLTEQARRVRAAIGYSDLLAKDIADRLGMSPSTFNRRTSRTHPIYGFTPQQLYQIAEWCGVPDTFMEHGLEPRAPTQPPVEDRMSALERQLDALTAELHQTGKRRASKRARRSDP